MNINKYKKKSSKFTVRKLKKTRSSRKMSLMQHMTQFVGYGGRCHCFVACGWAMSFANVAGATPIAAHHKWPLASHQIAVVQMLFQLCMSRGDFRAGNSQLFHVDKPAFHFRRSSSCSGGKSAVEFLTPTHSHNR